MTGSPDQRIWIDGPVDPPAGGVTGVLAGVVVGVKDNIDVAGFATTAGCPEFARRPERDADCVARLRAGGAVIAGKTNMDQFATGLTGTRSPYGAPSCVADARVISGGSSSGSAVAVAAGQCDIALGTDTAGSGRVPAALNGIVGLKPTRGLVSTAGVVPACRSIDCVSVFARSVRSARDALAVMRDPAGRAPAAELAAGLGPLGLRVGVPAEIAGDDAARTAFAAALGSLRAVGVTTHQIDFAPFAAAGDLLYGGPWVAERLAAVGGFIARNPGATYDPTVLAIITGASGLTAVDAFRGMYALQEFDAATRETWDGIDVLALPTITIAPTHDAVAHDPLGASTALGTYTRFVNLLDLCAISVPAGTRADGIPFGLQLVAPAGADGLVCDVAEAFAARTAATVRLAVVGAHLRGQPLNHQLTRRGARLVAQTTTAAEYRLFRLAGTAPPKPGLVHAGDDGASIELEVWELDLAAFGSFVAEVPPPLAIGTVRLADGAEVNGFVCEPRALEGAVEITAHGGWRAALAAAPG